MPDEPINTRDESKNQRDEPRRVAAGAGLLRLFRAGAVFLGLLLVSYLAPWFSETAYYRFHIRLPDWMFFLPQVLFPYDRVFIRSEHASHGAFTDAAAVVWGAIQGVVVMIAFSWFARNVPLRYLPALALAVILGLGYAVVFGFELFGMRVEFDGP